jgi:hypothetical protein
MRRAVSKSTWLVPMQKHPTAFSFCPERRRIDVRARSDADEIDVADRVEQVRPGERVRQTLDVCVTRSG